MKLFIDTGNVEEIKEVASWGVLEGVTTNPTLIAKEGKDFKEVVKEIVNLVNCPLCVETLVSAQLTAAKSDEMLQQAEELIKLDDKVVIKIPISEEGLKVVKILSERGIKTNVTLNFSANQALMAAKAGATYVSILSGRLDDIGNQGADVVRDARAIFDLNNIKAELIVAAIHHPYQVIEAALAGAHIATLPYAILKKMVKHPLTDVGVDRFLKDWETLAK